jgi:hypothetical protein
MFPRCFRLGRKKIVAFRPRGPAITESGQRAEAAPAVASTGIEGLKFDRELGPRRSDLFDRKRGLLYNGKSPNRRPILHVNN